MNCETLTSIDRDCSSGIGGIYPIIYIGETKDVDWDAVTFNSTEDFEIDTIDSGSDFEKIEFRNNVGSFSEEYAQDNEGAVVFTQTLTFPIVGRDAARSRKITVMASGQRRLDIIVRQNDGKYVYLRDMVLSEVGEGTGVLKTDGSKYSLTFTGESEQLSYYIDADAVASLLPTPSP